MIGPNKKQLASELAKTKRKLLMDKEDWVASFDDFMDSLIGLDDGSSIGQIVDKASALADARAERIDERWKGV